MEICTSKNTLYVVAILLYLVIGIVFRYLWKRKEHKQPREWHGNTVEEVYRAAQELTAISIMLGWIMYLFIYIPGKAVYKLIKGEPV